MNLNDGLNLTFLPINVNGTGDNVVVPAVPGKAILVWKIMDVVGATTNLTAKDGVGGNPLSGPVPVVPNGSMTLPFDGAPWFQTSPGNAFVINSSGSTVQQSGVVGYTLSPNK